jgi:uncharacterized membrane protein YfcA
MLIPFSISVIFLLAGFVQGMTGFGSALVAMPLLSLCIDVKGAVPLCTLSSVVITTFLAMRLKKHLDWRKIFPLCIAAIPGIFVGITLLKKVDSASLSIGLGVLLIAYSCYSLLVKSRPRTIHPAWSYMAGFLSGAIGAAFSAGGPPTIIYATQSDWNKDEIKATLSGFFLFNSYCNATAHAVSGMTTVSVLSLFLYAAPCVLLGTVLGSHCYGRMERAVYLKVIFAFLILMGTMMIVSAW